MIVVAIVIGLQDHVLDFVVVIKRHSTTKKIENSSYACSGIARRRLSCLYGPVETDYGGRHSIDAFASFPSYSMAAIRAASCFDGVDGGKG